jgi:hypothetical protein
MRDTRSFSVVVSSASGISTMTTTSAAVFMADLVMAGPEVVGATVAGTVVLREREVFMVAGATVEWGMVAVTAAEAMAVNWS